MSLRAFIQSHHQEIIREFASFATTLIPPGAILTDVTSIGTNFNLADLTQARNLNPPRRHRTRRASTTTRS